MLGAMTLPNQMLAIAITDGVLTPTQLPLPVPATGEVLLRTAYIGVNRADLMQRDGLYPPPEGASPLPGLEVSGHIAALGPDVHGWNIGDPVCALLSGGGYAAYAAVPAAQLLPIPHGIDLKHAATLPEAAATSIMALVDEAGVRPGERVLIHGGTSGLGILMIQIARALGAEVFTTVGSDEKIAFLAPFGVTAINHRTQPFETQLPGGVDVIIDTLGGPALGTHLGLLRRGGRMVSLALMQGPRVEPFKLTRMLTHHLRWSGATLRSRTPAQKAEIIQKTREIVWPALENGTIRPVADRVFSLPEAEKALLYMEERLHLGKILLEVPS